MEKIKPKKLNKNDSLFIIAPGARINKEIFLNAIDFFSLKNYKIKFLDNIYSEYYFMAGTKKRRASELLQAFNDDNSSLVFCARGGGGTFELLSEEIEGIFQKNWKIFIGSSDNTYLIQYFLKKNRVVFYGPVFSTNNLNEKIIEDNWKILEGEYYTFSNLELLNPEKYKPIEGELIGGCLSICASMIGTEFDIDYENKIIFWEDIDEKPYRILRMFWQFEKAGKLKNIKAIIFGEMTGCIQNINQNYSLKDIILYFFDKYDFPIYFGLKSGHSVPNLILPMGINYRLEENKLIMLEKGVVD